MRKILSILIPLLIVTFSIIGLTRLRFETDILEVLPTELPAVQSLKTFRKHFAEDRQIVVLLTSENEAISEEDTADLVQDLRQLWPNCEITYKSSLEENPELFARSVANLWTYAPPESLQELSTRLNNPDALATHLQEVKDDLQNSFDQEQSLIASYDPLGFLNHPALNSLRTEQASFESENGRHRIILVSKKFETSTSYANDAIWIAKLRKDIQQWSYDQQIPLTFNLTGGPVFNAEIGGGMEKDMSGTLTFTSILIALLFIIVQRNFRQLLLINIILLLTFLITLGIAGFILGSLNLVSVGFAAILLGLVIDYAIVIIRESLHAPSTPQAIRKLVAPSILWAALSTASVFGVLFFSTFTGVRQLGALIAIGLIVGALITLTIAPTFLAKYKPKPISTLTKPFFPNKTFAIATPILCILTAAIVFSIKGLPSLSMDLNIVEPTTSEANTTFKTIQQNFPSWSENNTILLTSSNSLDELKSNAAKTNDKLNQLQTKNTINNFQWHTGFIPDITQIKTNIPVLKYLAENHDNLIQTLDQAGFTEKGQTLDSMILKEFNSIAENPNTILNAANSDPLIKLFYHQDTQGTYHFTGRMLMTKPFTQKDLPLIDELAESGTRITGWPILQSAILPSVTRDFYVIFIPSAALLLLALLIVFRSWKEALISITVLLTALISINTLVVATGQSWNFLSGMAIPLIVGAGIDYSIHLIFALRRQNGNLAPVWNSVGKAILFCGLSTAIGFGSLTFASSELLRSMGIICSSGILITTALSLLIIPGLWKKCHKS